MRTLLLALLVVGTLLAQRHKVNINTETPEGQVLQQIGEQSDEAKKLAMFEKFTQDYAKSENLAWVYTQMQPLYVKAGQPDKAIEIGDKLMALDPGGSRNFARDPESSRGQEGSRPGEKVVQYDRPDRPEGDRRVASPKTRTKRTGRNAPRLRQTSEHVFRIRALRHGSANHRPAQEGRLDRNAGAARSAKPVSSPGEAAAFSGLPPGRRY